MIAFAGWNRTAEGKNLPAKVSGAQALLPSESASVEPALAGLWSKRVSTAATSAQLGEPSGLRIFCGFALVAIWLLAASQLLLWSRLQVMEVGYDLSAARGVVQKLEQRRQELQIEAALLSSPARVGERAGSLLGMRPPRPGEVIGER